MENSDSDTVDHWHYAENRKDHFRCVIIEHGIAKWYVADGPFEIYSEPRALFDRVIRDISVARLRGATIANSPFKPGTNDCAIYKVVTCTTTNTDAS